VSKKEDNEGMVLIPMIPAKEAENMTAPQVIEQGKKAAKEFAEKLKDAEFVQEVKPEQSIAVVEGVGIYVAGGGEAPTFNGKPIEIKPLEGEALEIRKRHRKMIADAHRANGWPVSDPIDASETSPVDSLVMNPGNPYISLYREYQAEMTSLEQMINAIDIQVIGDSEVLDGFRWKEMPDTPQLILDGEKKVRDKHSPEEWENEFYKLRKKLGEEFGEIRKHLEACRRVEMDNLANLRWLQEALTRNFDNVLYTAKLRAVMKTHEQQTEAPQEPRGMML